MDTTVGSRAGAADDPLEASSIPSEIGPYRILDILGRGGMGTVYLAEQLEPVRRQVALKVLNHSKRTERGIARFEAERQALALMNHPSIATVYEAGTTPQGLPFFAMEPVVGLPLLAYCTQEQLDLAGRLDLFCQICDAVQHAHQKLVIHRDLKPSNILVTLSSGKPLCKVIDFGIATGFEQPLVDSNALRMRAGATVGTPIFMSPEQIAGESDIDARADVYALGVVLYRLVTGALPFDTEEVEPYQVMLRILDEEPPKPSLRFSTLPAAKRRRIASHRSTTPTALERRLRGGLDAIVGKAMARERAHRYGSATELKEDVERLRWHIPIHAVPPSTWYRVSRWALRHRPTALAMAATTLALLVGLIVASLALVRARSAAVASRAAERRATATVAYLRKVLASADPGVDGREVRVVDVLTNASTLVGTDLADQPLVEAAVCRTIGETLLELGAFAESQPALKRAIAIDTRELGPDSLETVESVNALGRLLYKLGHYEEAATNHRRALARQRQALGREDPTTLWTTYNLAKATERLGQWKEAEELYREVVATRSRLLGPDHLDTLVGVNALSLFLSSTGRNDEAERLERRAIDSLTRVAGPEHPDTLRARANLAAILNRKGRRAEAEKLCRETLEPLGRVLGPEHSETLSLSGELAVALREQGQPAAAEAVDRRLLAARKARLGPDHPDTVETTTNLGLDLLRLGRLDEAEASLSVGLEGARRTLPPGHPRIALAEADYAECLIDQGRLEQAEPILVESRSILSKRGLPEAARAARLLAELHRRTEPSPERAGVSGTARGGR